jgi:hypothetical protein
MKTPEDEAFDELAKRQGSWGGGFPAKRKMAADKLQELWNEDEWRRNNWRCGHGWLRGEQCEICNAAQEPVCPACKAEVLCECVACSSNNYPSKPVQEPVARVSGVYGGRFTYDPINRAMILPIGMALYAGPPPRTWVGLTDEEIDALWQEWKDAVCLDHKTWAKAIEAKLKERNHGT